MYSIIKYNTYKTFNKIQTVHRIQYKTQYNTCNTIRYKIYLQYHTYITIGNTVQCIEYNIL